MKIVKISQAKRQLSELIGAALSGEEVIIQVSDTCAVRLVPVTARELARKPGAWKGRVRIAGDFDETPREIIDSFYDSEIEPCVARGPRKSFDESAI